MPASMGNRCGAMILAVALTACAAAQAPGAAKRESGQSQLMGQTFAGQNKCNPEDHERPFVIEWDATDMSSFESLAKRDVVVVRYEGCKLRILDGCRDDSVPGAYGSYRPVSWTAGSLERVEIGSEADLYAKLPLGVGELGGRVAGGEKFRMEYFVAGTRNATRPGIYRGDLADNPGCQGATHFVYGYNLGAFALGSTSESSLSAGAACTVSVRAARAAGARKPTSRAAIWRAARASRPRRSRAASCRSGSRCVPSRPARIRSARTAARRTIPLR